MTTPTCPLCRTSPEHAKFLDAIEHVLKSSVHDALLQANALAPGPASHFDYVASCLGETERTINVVLKLSNNGGLILLFAIDSNILELMMACQKLEYHMCLDLSFAQHVGCLAASCRLCLAA